MSEARLTDLLSPGARAALERDKAAQLIARTKNVPSLKHWLPIVSPSWTWNWRWQEYVYPFLEQVGSGELDRLMIFLPPRHGKSELVTIRYPIWRLEKNPMMRVIIAAHTQQLANKFSRAARRIAIQRLSVSEERKATAEWHLTEGGLVKAVGVSGAVTGEGGHLILIDDPIKSRAEAESLTHRDALWDWYTNDLYTRLEPNGAIILTLTRWHEDDLAGRILNSPLGKNWKVVILPAIAEENDPLGRQSGEALEPSRYPIEELREIEEQQVNDFLALYQQRPVSRTGNLFDRSWFKPVAISDLPKMNRKIRYWDKAGTQGGGAYTCGVLMGLGEDMNYYVLDIVRGQWAAPKHEDQIKTTAEQDGKLVRVIVEQEPGSGGKESAEATVRNLAGFSVWADKVSGPKELRAEPLASQAKSGNVYYVIANWNYSYLSELASFPSGQYRDQVDASSGAFNHIAQRPAPRVYIPGRGYLPRKVTA